MKTVVIYARVSSSNDRQDTSRQIGGFKEICYLTGYRNSKHIPGAYFRCKEN